MLRLGKILPQKLADQFFQPMAIGVSAHQPRGGFGAIDRGRHHPQIMADRRQIEAREMIELQPGGIGEQRAQIEHLQRHTYAYCSVVADGS